MPDVAFKDNSRAIKAQLEKNIAQALYRVGMKWLDKVKPLIPVDTSNLLKSAVFKVDISKQTVIVGIKQAGTYQTTTYAPFVELGTRKMAAQPYLRPSITNYINEYEAEVRKALGEGWNVITNTDAISY